MSQLIENQLINVQNSDKIQGEKFDNKVNQESK